MLVKCLASVADGGPLFDLAYHPLFAAKLAMDRPAYYHHIQMSKHAKVQQNAVTLTLNIGLCEGYYVTWGVSADAYT